MPALLNIFAPIFMIVLVGYIMERARVFDLAAFRAIGRFVMLIALPLTLFNATSRHTLSDIFDVRYFAAYLTGSVAVFGVIYLTLRLLKRPAPESGLFALGASAANTGFIGFPIASQILGDVAGVAAGLSVIVEGLIIIPLGMMLSQMGTQRASLQSAMRGAFGRTLRMPLLWATAIGFAFSAFEFTLPALIQTPLSLLSAASAPLALFYIGGILSTLRVELPRSAVTLAVLGKLALHPLAVFAIIALWPPEDRSLAVAAVLLASAPVITIFPLLAQPSGQERQATLHLMLSTLIAAITMP